ncbi:MAG TPA: hypothetical protein VGE08_21585 [Steroidobacter sp.]|uniref:hypothetical protein n=1 Tax=Steroidobacter sp. TaxID=1978227 RepID=UPI002ED97A55
MSFQIRPKLRIVLPRLLAGLVVSMAAAAAGADELTTPPAPTASEQANRPSRGMSMEKVEATFGAPTQRAAPVGEPPITRWEYPGFVVYFEHQLVIHTVAIG